MEQSVTNNRLLNRRHYTIQTLSRSLYNPRRATARRNTDRRYPVIDEFDRGLVALALVLIVFSCLDALFTLRLIDNGGSELNPVMNYFLMMGTAEFLAVKLFMTAIPAVILVSVGNVILFNRFRGRTALATLVGLYAGVLVYELGLLATL